MLHSNPCALVRQSCSLVSNVATLVTINKAAIDILATTIEKEGFGKKPVDWDDCGWHYIDKNGGPLTAQYVFVLDSLNFCFWPHKGLEYEHLAVSLRNVLESDPDAFSAINLASMTVDKLSSWFPNHVLPQLEERVDCLQEIGHVLSYEYDGLAMNMIRSADQSAVKLVKLVLEKFPHFRDTANYNGRLVHFYKRAQILVGDIWASHGQSKDPLHPCSFKDMNELTMFADYRVPQILRAMNVLEYAPELASLIDSENVQELPWGGKAEVEIRAQTVIAVELLQQSLQAKGCQMMTVELDWLLWQKGEDTKDKILPHHRTLTIYY